MSVPHGARYRRGSQTGADFHLVPVGHARPPRDRLRPYKLRVKAIQQALDRMTRSR